MGCWHRVPYRLAFGEAACCRARPTPDENQYEVDVGPHLQEGAQGLHRSACEASASEPLMKCRNEIRRCQNRGLAHVPGSARGVPEGCPSGIRHVGAAGPEHVVRMTVNLGDKREYHGSDGPGDQPLRRRAQRERGRRGARPVCRAVAGSR